MRSNYWNIGKFADWVRGTPGGGAKSSEDWAQWRIDAQTKHPWRYWLVEEGFDWAQRTLGWPYYRYRDLRAYVLNRWVTRSHMMVAHPRDIKPGTWCDVSHRFLPCLFNSLVDFIEVETAWDHVLWDKEARAKYKPPRWARSFNWRSPEAGIARLEWAADLHYDADDVANGGGPLNEPTPQAVSAREVLALYRWWTVTRPARPDVYEASGFSGLDRHLFGNTKDPVEKAKVRAALDLMTQLEDQYETEDEEMMIRLIKIRNSLWT